MQQSVDVPRICLDHFCVSVLSAVKLRFPFLSANNLQGPHLISKKLIYLIHMMLGDTQVKGLTGVKDMLHLDGFWGVPCLKKNSGSFILVLSLLCF